MCDKCNACNHTKQNNIHGPDQSDYGFNNETNEIDYLGSCIYCHICSPRGEWAAYILSKKTVQRWHDDGDEEKEKLWIEYNEGKEK